MGLKLDFNNVPTLQFAPLPSALEVEFGVHFGGASPDTIASGFCAFVFFRRARHTIMNRHVSATRGLLRTRRLTS